MTVHGLHTACDTGLAETSTSAPAPAKPNQPRLVLAATILASSLAFIDGSVVNVGLPAIGQSLRASGAGLAWIVNSYLLPLSTLLLLGGAAGDHFGRKRLLLMGIALFAIASLLCALAPSFGWLLAGRALQGIGAAMLMPNSLAILGASFTGETRGKAIGSWAAVGAAAGALGPLLGGWLIDSVSWRAIFLINLPIAFAALVLATRYIAEDHRPGRPALDYLGALLATVALGGLTWGLTAVSAGQGERHIVPIALSVGLVSLVMFIVVEQRRGSAALLPLDLFRSTSFAGLNLLTLFLYAALGGLFILVPFVLIETKGYSATEAGAALLPLPVVIALASPTMGRIAGRVGSRRLLIAGSVVVAVGFLLATRIGGGGYWNTVFPAMLVIAFGMAGAVAPLTNAVLSSVSPDQTGIASGFNSAVARTGDLVATAALGFVLAANGAAIVTLAAAAALSGAGLALAAAVSGALWINDEMR